MPVAVRPSVALARRLGASIGRAAALCGALAPSIILTVSLGAALAPGLCLAATRPAAGCACAGGQPYVWHLPRGFPVPAVPADDPMSPAKVALGRRLFFDPRLSVTGRYSCGSCHQPSHAYTDGRRVAIGATGQALPHRTMSLVNAAYEIAFGWTEPGAPSLEKQMRVPMLNEHPVELGLKGRRQELLATLARDASYRRAFRAAFPGVRRPITFSDVVKAIATFERTLIFGDSPFDRYVFGDDLAALSPDAKAGMALFFSKRLGCAGCHSGIDFDGNWRDIEGQTGPASFANDGTSREPIRVPTLRDVALKAPYMHDGRYATLGEVLDHYVRIGREPDSRHGGTRDPRLKAFTLTLAERRELIAFLDSLTDPELARRASHSVAGGPNPAGALTRGRGNRSGPSRLVTAQLLGGPAYR